MLNTSVAHSPFHPQTLSARPSGQPLICETEVHAKGKHGFWLGWSFLPCPEHSDLVFLITHFLHIQGLLLVRVEILLFDVART